MITADHELEYEAEALGFPIGTTEHAQAVRRLRVYRCRELNRVMHCSDCPAYYGCAVIKEHLRDVAQGAPR